MCSECNKKPRMRRNFNALSFLSKEVLEHMIVACEAGIAINHPGSDIFKEELEDIKCELRRRELKEQWSMEEVPPRDEPEYTEGSFEITDKEYNNG